MATRDQIPKYHELMNPLLAALHELGGSASVEEISSAVASALNLSEELLGELHDPDRSGQTELAYRLAWARTYLKKYGIVDNSQRGVWVIVPEKKDVTSVKPMQVVKWVRDQNRKERDSHPVTDQADDELPEEAETWRSRLHHIMTQTMTPDAFERLVKRMLRESGFVQVEVTGKSGDGGIDGKGIVRVAGLLSFHVFFQCKRYQGAVSAGAIRDFRGAFVGRADKGLFVTTGTFTRDAVKEATRDGATPIDLMDGDQLADKLKGLNLGIKTSMVESVDVDLQWFESI